MATFTTSVEPAVQPPSTPLVLTVNSEMKKLNLENVSVDIETQTIKPSVDYSSAKPKMSEWNENSVLPALGSRAVVLIKRLQPVLSQFADLTQQKMTPANILKIEDFAQSNAPTINDFCNHLTQEGFSYTEKTHMSSFNAQTVYHTRIDTVNHVTAWTSRTRNRSQIVAKLYFVSKLYDLLTVQSQSDTNVISDVRENPEDALFQTTASQIESNTEITQGADVSTPLVVTHPDELQRQATTEPIYNYPLMTERFVRVAHVLLSQTDMPNQLIWSLNLPDGIYDALDSTTSSVLRSFTSIACDVELTFKVNANQAQCGRYVISHFPARQLCPNVHDNVYRQLQRFHAIIDVASSNDVVYKVPYEFVRPWIGIQTDEAGVIRGGQFATVTLTALSNVRIAESGVQTVPVNIYARLANVRLTGMRYPVAAQSLEPEGTPTPSPSTIAQLPESSPDLFDSVINIAGFAAKAVSTLSDPIGTISSVLHPTLAKGVEKMTTFIGGINNDHPPNIQPPNPLMPQSTHSFANAVGAVPLRKLRIEPTSNTPQLKDFHTSNTPKTTTEIAQIPSFFTRFNVTTALNSGALLVNLPVAILDPRYPLGPTVPGALPRPNDSAVADPRFYRQFPTVSYLGMMYTDYIGALVYEFDAVKTPSHNFSMQVAYIPFNGSPSDVTTEAQMQSCKWTTLDFRTNNRAKFITPFISFHLMRQYPHNSIGIGDLPNDPAWNINSNNFGNNLNRVSQTFQGVNVQMRDPGKIVVRLVNPLNPTPIVSNTIEVLVYVSAAPGFKFLVPRPFKGLPSNVPMRAYDAPPTAIQPPNLPAAFINQRIPAQSSLPDTQAGDEMTPPTNDPKKTFGTLIQSMELHDDIMTICKRNYFYTSLKASYMVTQTGDNVNAAWSDFPMFATIPISPYCVPNNFSDELSPAQVTRGPINPREALLFCFRWMRGSINITTVLKPANGFDKKPIMVTHVPPVTLPSYFSGTKLFPYTWPITSGASPPFHNTPGCGFASEPIIPSVNPTMTVEVPFYNPANYLDLQSPLNYNTEFAETLSKWNDLTPWTLGQLEFATMDNIPPGLGSNDSWMAENQFSVNCYSSLGDDAQLYTFMGTPPVCPGSMVRNLLFAGGLGQAPVRSQSREEINALLVQSGIEQNPGPPVHSSLMPSFFGSPSNTDSSDSRAEPNWWDNVKALIRLPHTINKITQTVDVVTQKFEDLKRNLALLVPEINLVQLSIAITALLNAYINPSKLAILTSVLTFFSLFPFVLTEVVDSLLARVVTLFRPTNSPVAQSNESFYESNSAIVSIFTSLFVEGMLVRDKVKTMPKCEENVSAIVTRYLGVINFSRTGIVCVIVYRICTALTALWNRLRRWCESYKCVTLLEVDQNFIDNFMKDYAYVMAEINSDVINFTKINKDRYWTTVISAYYLQAVMVKYKTSNPHLKTACTQIIQRANVLNSKVTAPPVRYEPYVMWMYGKPGVGKTTVLHEIMIDLAKSLNVHYPADPIYVVKPTSAYMNGLNRQPIVVFDDCGATSDNIVEPVLLSNFMAMKTCARMLIDKPRLEDKDAEFVAPLVGCTSNMKYWPVENAVRDKAALDRRRDLLVKVDWSPEAREFFARNPGVEWKVSSLPEELRKDYRYQRFIVEHDVYRTGHVPEGFQPRSPDPSRTYEEFREYILQEHKKYHELQVDLMYKRYKKSLSLAKKASESLTDPASLKLALISITLGCEEGDSDVPLETLRHALLTLERTMPEYYRTLPETTRSQLSHMSRMQPPPVEDPVVGQSNMDFVYVPTSTGSPWYRQKVAHLENREPDRLGFLERATQYMSSWTDSPLPDWVRPHCFSLDFDVNSTCTVCNKPVTELAPTNYVKTLCPNSVEGNIHWTCYQCHSNAPPIAINNVMCGYCRCPSVAVVAHQQVVVNNYKKAWYLLKLGSKLLTKMVCYVLDRIQMIAIVSYFVFLISMICMMMSNLASEQQINTNTSNDIQWYIEHFGTLPDDYLGRDSQSRPMFSEDGQVYVVNNGSYIPIVDAVNAQSPPPEEPESQDVQFTSEPNIPVRRLPKCVHATCNNMDIPLIVEDTDEEEPTYEIQFMFGVAVLTKWPLHFCETPQDLPPGLTDAEIETHMNDPATPFTTERCSYKNAFPTITPKLIETHRNLWIEEPETIPKPFRKPTAQVVNSDPVEVSRWRLVQVHLIEMIRKKIVPALTHTIKFILDYMYTIIGLLAVIFGFYYGYRLIWSDTDGYYPEVEAQSMGDYNEGHSQVLQRKNKSTRTIVRSRQAYPVGQSQEPMPQNIESTYNLVRKNTVKLKHGGLTIDAIGIYGSTILIPRHSYAAILHYEEGIETIVTHRNFSRTLQISQCDSVDYREYEMVAVVLPTCFSFRNIIRNLNKSTDTEYTLPSKIWVASTARETMKYVEVSGITENAPIVSSMKLYGKRFDYLNSVPQTFRVKGFQAYGLCMSIAIDESGQILGFHIGGLDHTNEGYLVPVFSDCFTVEAQSLGSMRYIRTVDDAPYHKNVSKIRSSLIAPFMHDSITEPCIQSRNDPRLLEPCDPLIAGCLTIGAPTNSPSPQLLPIVEDAVFDCLVDKFPVPFTTAPTTIDVAIAPRLPKLNSLDKNTSVGYPMSINYVKKGDIIDYDKDGSLIWKKPKERENFLRSYAQREKGCPPETIYVAHLKDERRRPEKNRKPGGTRVFHISPFELMVSSRMALLPFLEACVSDPIASCHAITLNPDSFQWTQMINKFTAKGNNFIQLDFSKFSDSMPHEFVSLFFNLVRRYYQKHQMMNPAMENVIKSLQNDIMHSRVLVYSDLYEITNGVLQGHPLTAQLNSFVNILEQVYIYSVITNNTPYQFFEDCAIMVMGDDVVISTNDSVIEYYNAQTITQAFATLNVTVTDPFDKTLPSDLMPKSYPVREFVLLSRSVSLHPVRQAVMAPVKMQSALDVPLWVHRKPSLESTLEVVHASLILAFTHGPVYYQAWKTYLRIVYEASDLPLPVLPTWRAIDEMLYANVPLRTTPLRTICSCPFKCLPTLYSVLKEMLHSSDRLRRQIAATCLTELHIEVQFSEMMNSDDAVVPQLSPAMLNEITAIRNNYYDAEFSYNVGG